jgi:hypothetical protein
MTKKKPSKTFLPLPDNDGGEPPIPGDGFWFTDALDEGDREDALSILAGQTEITEGEVAHLKELFERLPGEDNFTRHRLDLVSRARDQRDETPDAAQFVTRLLSDLRTLAGKAELQGLLAATSPLGNTSDLMLAIKPRKAGRTLRGHKELGWEFTKFLSFQKNPERHIATPLKRKPKETMKEIVYLLSVTHGWSRSKVMRVLRPKKKQFKPRPE